MEKLQKHKRFLYSQLLFAFICVLVCSVITSITAYKFLQRKMVDWIVENNEKILTSCIKLLDDTVLTNTNEIYNRVLLDSLQTNGDKNAISVYVDEPLENHLLGLTETQDYLKKLKSSYSYVRSISLFFPNNTLLLSDEMILYDLFYSHRIEQMSYWLECIEALKDESSKNRFFYACVDDRLRIVRPILSINEIELLVAIDYNLEDLRNLVSNFVVSDFGNVWILSENGEILFSLNPVSDSEASRAVEYARTLGEQSSKYIWENGSGAGNILSFRKSTHNDWVYVALTRENRYMESAEYILQSIYNSALIAILFGMVPVLLLMLHRSKPILALSNMVKNPRFSDAGERETYAMICSAIEQMETAIESKDETLRRMNTVLQDKFLFWLLSESPRDPEEIRCYISLAQIHFPHNGTCIFAVRLLPDDGSDTADGDLEYAVAETHFLLKTTFEQTGIDSSLGKNSDTILGILNFDDPADKIFNLIESLMRKNINGFARVASVSAKYDSLELAVCAAKTIVHNLKYHYLYPDIRVFREDILCPRIQQGAFCDEKWIQSYSDALRKGDKALCRSVMQEIVVQLRQCCSPEEAERIFLALSVQIEKFLCRDEFWKNALLRSIKNASNIDALSEQLSQIVDYHLDKATTVSSEVSETMAKLIERAQKYIAENLTDPQLSLEAVAAHLKISPAYLSRNFCKVCSVTFVEYVTSLKMECAIRLLTESSESIDQIASRLGYSSTNYFISRFKKHFDMTPNVYRKLKEKEYAPE